MSIGGGLKQTTLGTNPAFKIMELKALNMIIARTALQP